MNIVITRSAWFTSAVTLIPFAHAAWKIKLSVVEVIPVLKLVSVHRIIIKPHDFLSGPAVAQQGQSTVRITARHCWCWPEDMIEDIDTFVELDRLNMAPIIVAAGGSFDPNFRRKKIVQERERGALFLSALRDGEVVAYLEYMPEANDVWNVMSIQIHPLHQNGAVLYDLLAAAWTALSVSGAITVQSSVHVANEPSLRLHRKLGFLRTGERDDRILFEADGQALCERLERFGKRKDKANKQMHRTLKRR